jgi:hypothetical protein
MSPEQEQFMRSVIAEIGERVLIKFPKGAKQYKTTLHQDHTVSFLHEMAMDELTDLPTYMIALKYRLDTAIKLLESAVELEDWEMVLKAIAIFK